MTQADVDIARFFARLANLADISKLDSNERRRLAGFLLRIPGARSALHAEGRHLRQQDRDVAPAYIDAVYSHVREMLPSLVDGEPIIPPRSGGTVPVPTWRVVDGALVEEQFPSEHALAYFFQLCRQKRFPFARCPTCRTIFARVKRQRFCSPACKNEAFTASHQERRREYMRKYMAKRRAKTRKAARTKGR